MKPLLAVALAFCAFALPCAAADAPDTAFLQKLFATATVDPSLFDEAFTQRVPLGDVQLLIDGYRQRLGSLKAVVHEQDADRLTFARGSLRATLDFDAQGKADGLRFHDEQSEIDRTALERVLRADRVMTAWFTQGFLDQTPAAAIDAQNAQIRATEGAFVRVESRAGVYYAVFTNAENITEIETSTSGKIAYLRLGTATPRVNGP